MSTLTPCALVLTGFIGCAPESNNPRIIMSHLGRALAIYEMSQGSTNIMEHLIDTYITQLEHTNAIMLACVIIGYAGPHVGEKETDREILVRVGSIIGENDHVRWLIAQENKELDLSVLKQTDQTSQ